MSLFSEKRTFIYLEWYAVALLESDSIMKTVAIVGAGLMTKPMVDYFLDGQGYSVTMLNRTLANAERVLAGHPRAQAVQWTPDNPDVLDEAVSKSDVVVSMVPKPVHIHIAEACLKNSVHMVTSSYEVPELVALDSAAKEKGIIILNELGEVPGIDHFGTQMVLNSLRSRGVKVDTLHSYGSNIPAFDSDDNPFHYKFAWDPRTFTVASQTGAAYFEKGEKIVVPGKELFLNPRRVGIEGLGEFESYPNKDIEKYIQSFGLPEDCTFYRGLLRHPGYCENMIGMIELGLFSDDNTRSFNRMSYRQFMAEQLGDFASTDLEQSIANRLGYKKDSEFIEGLRWLGLLSDNSVAITEGTTLDVVLDTMTEKMAYKPGEHDMIIVHVDASGEDYSGKRVRETATMCVEGEPYSGNSAISKAVALPVAIAVRNILDGEITATGAQMPPTLPELAPLALDELKDYGYSFEQRSHMLPVAIGDFEHHADY